MKNGAGPRKVGAGPPRVDWGARAVALEDYMKKNKCVLGLAMRSLYRHHFTEPLRAYVPLEYKRLRRLSTEISRRNRIERDQERSRHRRMKNLSSSCHVPKRDIAIENIRGEAMIALRGCGWKLEAIGEVFGVSRQRALQVITQTAQRED